MVSHGRGFTLIELMVTIAILGILLVAGVPLTQAWVNGTQQRDAGNIVRQAVDRAKASALRNAGGVIERDKPAVMLCLVDQRITLARMSRAQSRFDCASAGADSVIWSSELPKRADLQSEEQDFNCLALDNRALPIALKAAGTQCSTSDILVKVGKEDALTIKLI